MAIGLVCTGLGVSLALPALDRQFVQFDGGVSCGAGRHVERDPPLLRRRPLPGGDEVDPDRPPLIYVITDNVPANKPRRPGLSQEEPGRVVA
jgi:hypothetical protein